MANTIRDTKTQAAIDTLLEKARGHEQTALCFLNCVCALMQGGRTWDDPVVASTRGAADQHNTCARELRAQAMDLIDGCGADDLEEDDDPEACPGCGCKPGDGITSSCNHPDGCGYGKLWEA